MSNFLLIDNRIAIEDEVTLQMNTSYKGEGKKIILVIIFIGEMKVSSQYGVIQNEIAQREGKKLNFF